LEIAPSCSSLCTGRHRPVGSTPSSLAIYLTVMPGRCLTRRSMSCCRREVRFEPGRPSSPERRDGRARRTSGRGWRAEPCCRHPLEQGACGDQAGILANGGGPRRGHPGDRGRAKQRLRITRARGKGPLSGPLLSDHLGRAPRRPPPSARSSALGRARGWKAPRSWVGHLVSHREAGRCPGIRDGHLRRPWCVW
jgi:hypothetical protein